jgi:DNA-binding MarR family transcriptional regulator
VDRGAKELRGAIHAFVRRLGLLEQAETPCGMPLPLSHAHALMELLWTPEISQQELAERLALSKSNVSRLVDRFVTSGRVRRKKDGHDGRACRLVLTDKGQRLAVELDRRSIGRHRALLASLPARERTKVLQSLALLANACHGEKGSP